MFKLLVNSKQKSNFPLPKLAVRRFIGSKQLQNLESKTNEQQNSQKKIIKYQNSTIHLYHNYFSRALIQTSSESISEKHLSKNHFKHQIQVKSHIISLFNLNKSQSQSILSHLELRLDEISLIQCIEFQKQSIWNRHIIIYFTNIAISEQFYVFLKQRYPVIILYLKDVLILVNQQESLINYLSLVNKPYIDQKDNQNLIIHQKWIQLPLCPTCLTKIEYEVTGISNNQLQLGTYPTNCITCKFSKQNSQECFTCHTKEDIWICMVCGNIGCGRYKNGDAFKHFQQTGHIITLEFQTQRIWNYLSDCFSHKIHSAQQPVLKFDYDKKQYQEESLQTAFWAYCSVISQELQRQRNYYQKMQRQEAQKFQREDNKLEEKKANVENEIKIKQQNNKKISKKINKNTKKLKELRQKCSQERQILSQYQLILKQDFKQVQLSQIEQQSLRVLEKKNTLKDLEGEIQKILNELSM